MANVLDDVTPLDFVRPLVRAAVRGQLPRLRAEELHERAARIVAERGAPPAAIGVHLLGAGRHGDPWTAERLHEAGLVALSQGAPEEAARYLQRALDEPPAPAQRLALLRALGAAEVRRHGARGLHAYRQAVELAGDAATRAQIAVDFAQELNMLGDVAAATDVLAPVVEHLDQAGAVAAQAEGIFVFGAMMEAPPRPAALERLTKLFGRLHRGERLHRTSLADLAIVASAAGGPADQAAELARSSLDGAERSGANSTVVGAAAMVLAWADALDEAREVLDGVVDNARSRGHLVQYASACSWRAHVHFRAGALAEAEADARAAVRHYGELGRPGHAAVAFLLDVLAERGDLDEAEALLRDGGFDDDLPGDWYTNWLVAARG